MAECFVYRNEKGEIEKVNAPNGKESELFSSINNLTKDKEESLKLWAQVYTPTFKTWFGDWETLQEAKGYIGDIKGFYKDIVNDGNLEQGLHEAAIQLNSSESEARGARKAFGDRLSDIALKLFPNAKLGDKFKSNISKAVDPNGEPLVVYHGSGKSGIEIFDNSKGVWSKGFYFTSELDYANYYYKSKLRRTGEGEIYSAFLNIKSLVFEEDAYSANKNNDGSDGILTNVEGGGKIIYVVFNPNQIKSIYNDGGFKTEDDNIYRAKNKNVSLIGKLQSEGKVGKRVGTLTYEIPVDIKDFNLIDQQIKAQKVAEQINKAAGKEVVTTTVSNGNAAIVVDSKINDLINRLVEPSDLEKYRKFLNDNLYTNKENPTTTELINNAAKMAKDLGRDDLANVARLIYKYIDKNASLKTRIIGDMFEETGETAKAYYNKGTNNITFARSTMGTGTLEYESAVVLHEILHGLTFQPWLKGKLDVPLSGEEKDFKNVVDNYYNYFKSKRNADLSRHEFSNAEEFLMGALLDRPFQDHLRSIDAETGGRSFLQFVKDILKGFLKLFGIKPEDSIVDRIDPNTVQSSMIDALSDYLSKMSSIRLVNGLKEDGRNYGLSFSVTAQQDYDAESKKLREERDKMKASLSDNLRVQLKDSIEKSILSIKSFGSNIRKRIPESQEGFKTIFRQLKKLEDPAYNLDQIDFFFDFTSEIQAILNVANDKVSKLLEDETIDDVDFKLKEYEDIVSAVRHFDPILSEIQNIKIQLENLGYKVSLKDLNELNIKRDRIESVYSMGVFPLVTDKFIDILSPSSKKAVDISNGKIDELDKRIALATKADNKSRVKQLEKDKTDEQNKIDRELLLNSDKVQSWLRGQMGDSNILNVWLMAGVSNSNPLVSALSKFIRDKVGEVAPQVLNLMNNVQDNLEAYEKATNRSRNDIGKFNSPLIQTHKIISGKNEKGEYTYEEKNSLLHEFNGNHIQELQKFKRDLTDLFSQKRDLENSENPDLNQITELEKKIKETKEQQRQFTRDYMEQKYTPAVHEALDMLYEDLGGYSVWDYMGPILARIEDTETAIEQESDPGRLADLYNQLDDHNLELSRLGALYEKSPDTRELKVAEKLKERRELLKKYSNFILTDKGKIQFDTQFARMKRKLSTGEISPERYERWLEDNTVTQLTPAYWERKRDILERLNGIMTTMGAKTEKDETMAKLYRDAEEIAQPHRDSNGIIDGTDMSNKELSDVKTVEEKIEDAKNKMANVFGLTKLERIQLANLNGQINELNSMIWLEPDLGKKQSLTDYKNKLEDEALQISSKKKKIPQNLLEQYFAIIKELAELDESGVTKYYLDESQEQLEQQMAKVDISKIPEKFVAAGRTYQKSGTVWLEIGGGGIQQREATFVENIYRDIQGNANYLNSDWYKTNHITRTTFKRNDSYSPGNNDESPGEWVESTDPTYAWKQTRPRNSAYILDNQPSLKYKQREIKDEYVNKNYKEDINGELRPKISGTKDNRFVNKDYQDLISSNRPEDAATTKMLRFLTETYFRAQEAIPKGLRPGYELPSIRKTDTERLTSQNLKQSTQDFFSYLGQVGRLVKDKVIANDQDKDILYGYNDDFNGIVPIKFIGDIDSKDQSIDLPKSILTFASEMLKREQLIKALPFANAVKDIVNNPDYRPVKTKNGVVQSIKKKFLPKNTELAVKAQTSNTALQVNEIIKSEIYGEQMKDQPASKLVDTSLALGAKVMLGFNFISSVQNYANAFTQSIIETESKNRNFTMKNFFAAQKIYYANIDKLMSDLGKYGNKSYINQFFDYFGGINYKIFSKNHKTLAYDKVGEFTRALSVPNQITEHMLNYHMGIAIALNYRVDDGHGNMVPIFNAFTLKDGKLVQKEGFNVSEKDRKEIISRLNSSSRRVNGEYGDRILLDKYVLGRLATFMNRYLIPFVVKRYGARKFDIQDGQRDEGYWRLLGKLFVKDIKAKSIPIVGGWKYYTAEEKQAVLKTSTELGFTIMFALAIGAMGGDDNKKIKDNSILENNLLYALKGIQQQNEAFMPVPGVGFDDLLRKVQNPFPILGKFKNLVSLINDGSHTAWYEMGLPGVQQNDVKYMQKSGWHSKGDFKMFSDFQKLIGLKKIENYMYPAEAIKAQESISRIK